MKSTLIAPCGMNCAICSGYLRAKNRCFGCRTITTQEYCKNCIIRNCSFLKENKIKFCSSKCGKYPCKRLKDLDKRYRTKYDMSMLENLENIEHSGVR